MNVVYHNWIHRPCGVGTSSFVALAGGWVNKTSLSSKLYAL